MSLSDDEFEECWDCDGTGTVERSWDGQEALCDVCGGSGHVPISDKHRESLVVIDTMHEALAALAEHTEAMMQQLMGDGDA